MKKNLLTILLSILVSGLTAFGMIKAADSQPVPGQSHPVASDYYRTVNLDQTEYPDFTYAAETAVDAVVYVQVTIRSRQQNYQIDPFFRYFFGDEMPSQREQQGSGSGVIIREDGYIVTNNHVVANASKVEVTLNNNKTYEATVVGTDPATDVALLKIDADNLPAIKFGNSDDLRLGEWVLAIGSPLGLRGTITAGIVSAKGRSMAALENPQERQLKIESFIQTDAAVNPGNSGGALVNKAGELVGINTAIISQTGSYSGYSFAVPVNIVKKVVGDLIDFGSVKRAVLGITMQGITEDIAKDLKLSSMKGVYIVEVSKGGAADKAGIRKGDVLVEIDGTEVATTSAVSEKVNSFHPGDKTAVKVIREGKAKEIEVEFQGTSESTGTVDNEGATAFYGCKLKSASQETLSRLGLKNGVEVVSVGPGKMLDAGAEEGFIILYVNDEPVSKPEDVVNLARRSRRSVRIEGISASGKTGYLGFGKDE